jgi:hypothetical protein
MAERYVWVVETWLKNQGRWYCWSAHTGRPTAWTAMRDARATYPEQRFRTIKYVSTKP